MAPPLQFSTLSLLAYPLVLYSFSSWISEGELCLYNYLSGHGLIKIKSGFKKIQVVI